MAMRSSQVKHGYLGAYWTAGSACPLTLQVGLGLVGSSLPKQTNAAIAQSRDPRLSSA